MEQVGVVLAAENANNYLKSLGQINAATEALAKGASAAAAALGVLEDSEVDAGKAARKFGEDSKKASEGLSILDRVVNGATERIGHLATDALASAGAAVLQWAADGVSASADFADGMNTFAAVAGGALDESGQTLEEFEQLFIDIGKELPVSTAAVQDAATQMAKGGIEPATIAAGGLKQTLLFAAAAELDLAKAAEIAAKSVAGWAAVGADANEKAALLAHSTDLLARAANASTVDVDELALGLYNVQGTARAAGVTLDETVTTLALLSPSFNSSAEAGNSMKNMLLTLQPATAPAAEAMAELGLLTAEGNSVFYDAEGRFVGMREAANKLQKAFGPLSNAQRTQALRTIFGNDALNAANVLIEQGADGYDAMTKSLAAQLSVQEQAVLKQQGFNTALDGLDGNLEALQITLFTTALPALTSMVNLLADGVGAVTDYADATIAGQTVLATVIDMLQQGFTPALIGATTALTAYAIVQAMTAGPAIAAFIIQIQTTTAALGAQATAAAAAVAPYALIAAAVGAVVYKYNEFNENVKTATQQLLESKPFWVDSTDALDEYGRASDATQQKLAPLADSIRQQRQRLEEQIESLGRRMAAGDVSEQQYQREMEAINAQALAIDYASDSLRDMTRAELEAATASMTATDRAATLTDATGTLGERASLTAQDIEKLAQQIEKTYESGQKSVETYARTQSEFLAQVEQRQAEYADKIAKLEAEKNAATTEDQKTTLDEQIKQIQEAYIEQEGAAAESFARQQAAQQAHLGQMLIDYTIAQQQLGNISTDKAIEIVSGLEKAYGLQESSTASTFLRMASSIDAFANDANADIDGLIGTLKDQQKQAADTQHAMDEYAKEYVAEAVTNFVEKQGEAEDYIAALEDVPNQVQSQILLPEVAQRQDEIDRIKRGLDAIPRNIRVHISAQNNIPEEFIPHSPTPFEMGIRGIMSALDDLQGSVITLPGVTKNLSSIQRAIDEIVINKKAPKQAEGLGKNIIVGLSKGMASNIANAVNETKRAANAILSQIKSSFGIHSPADETWDDGENVMLGLMLGMRNMVPELITEVRSIMDAMRGELDRAMAENNKSWADSLEKQLDVLGDIIDGFAQQVRDAVVGVYDGIADISRAMADSVTAPDQFSGGVADNVRRQLSIAEQEARQFEDPAQAAAYYDMRKKQILELAQLAQKLNDDNEKRRSDLDAEHAKNINAITDTELKAQDKLKNANEQYSNDLAKLQAELANAKTDAERREIQERMKERSDLAALERKAIQEELAGIAEARKAEEARYKQILEQDNYERAAAYARYEQQIQLIKSAQEAERKAFEERLTQNASVAELRDSIQAVLDNIETGEAGPSPLMNALYDMLMKLAALPGLATGGVAHAMQPYIVGEKGPELVVPGATSYVMAHNDTRRVLNEPSNAQRTSIYQGGTLNLGGISINGTNLSAAALQQAIVNAVNQVANNADVRVRMGVV